MSTAPVTEPRPLTFSLLRLLADGEFHSGEVLAQQLGVSRASVNNALQGVDQYGLTLYSVRGRGYRLLDSPQWLDASRIEALLGARATEFKIEVADSALSSNTLMLQRAAQHGASGSVLALEWQSGGRGRFGRTWHSGLGNALTFSLLWRFECGLAGLSGLSLAAGVALIRALRKLGANGAQLKWPNDVLGGSVEQGRRGKLAGILIEAQGDMLGPSAVVIGIGLNLALPQQVLQRIDQSATDLAHMTAALPERNLLLAQLLGALGDVLHEFAQRGFPSLRAEWEGYHYHQNKTVQLLMPDGKNIHGTVRGVSDEGALLLEIQNHATGQVEMRVFHAGEISLRGDIDAAA